MGRVPLRRVVEELDVIKYIGAGLGPRVVGPLGRTLGEVADRFVTNEHQCGNSDRPGMGETIPRVRCPFADDRPTGGFGHTRRIGECPKGEHPFGE